MWSQKGSTPRWYSAMELAQFIAHPTFAVWAACQLQTQTLPTPNVNNFSFVMRTQDDQDLGPDDGPRTCCDKTIKGAADLEQGLGPRAHHTCCTAKWLRSLAK